MRHSVRSIRSKLWRSMTAYHSRDTVASGAELQPSFNKNFKIRSRIHLGRAVKDVLLTVVEDISACFVNHGGQ